MKLLRIAFKNIGLFKDNFVIDLTAVDPVRDIAPVKQITDKIYTQNSIALLGVNASGKTTALRLIALVMNVVLGKKGLNDTDIPCGIFGDGSVMEVDFFYQDMFYRLISEIGLKEFSSKIGLDEKPEYYFKNEFIYTKTKSKVSSKKKLYDYTNKEDIRTIFERNKDVNSDYLKDDVSIIIGLKGSDVYYKDTLLTNKDFIFFYSAGKLHKDIINLFDQSIEKIEKKDKKLNVKFKNSDEPVICDYINSPEVLSSGTIKGTGLLEFAARAIEKGGYLVIDEIENHMHKKLVQTIIGLFNDEEVNPKGATIIFSTHYPEVIDVIERKDSIYILVRDADFTCNVIRYSEKVKRIELKKSEIFLSNYIKGTAPSYDSVRKVRDYLCQLTK